MPLFYWNGSENVQTTFARSNASSDFFLCCPGPSLKNVDPKMLQTPGATVVAVNTAYPFIAKPDYWVGMDRPECYEHTLLFEPFPKVFGTRYQEDVYRGAALKDCPATYFAQGSPGEPECVFDRLANESDFLWNKYTFALALHFCLWLGAKKVYLVGCDFGGEADYHDGRTLDDAKREENRKLYARQLAELKRIADSGREHGVEIVSATPDSPANALIGYTPLEVAARSARSRVVPNAFQKVLHTSDAEVLRWNLMEITPSCGVLMGLDKGAEWMLPWWWENYARFNNYPVAFIDYGLSDEMRQWCSQRGLVIPWQGGPGPIWHRKPVAMLRTPFDHTVYMEPDCEVRGDIGAMFSYCGYGVALTHDHFNPWSKSFLEVPFATGVVSYKRRTQLVQDWAREMIEHPEYRDDQMALNSLLARTDAKVGVMPLEFQWLRLAGDNPSALVMHWTGPDGKEIIRQQMADTAALPTTGPKVSILMPTYNTPQAYIDAAVKSCLAQTYADWELIVVDDGSQTRPVLPEDPRIVYREQYHKGYAQTFNDALALASGEYIARLDADDAQEPQRIARQVKYLLDNTECEAVTCAAWHIDEHGNRTELRPCKPYDAAAYMAGDLMDNPPNPSIIARREVYETAGGFPPHMSQAADAAWNFKVMASGAKFGHIDLPLYHYRRHAKSMTAEGAKTQFEEYRRLVERYAKGSDDRRDVGCADGPVHITGDKNEAEALASGF